MKKVLLPILSITATLFLFAFSPSEKNFSYKEINGQDSSEFREDIGEFVEFETTRYTSDKTTWSERRKTWTDFASVANLETIETTMNQN